MYIWYFGAHNILSNQDCMQLSVQLTPSTNSGTPKCGTHTVYYLNVELPLHWMPTPNPTSLYTGTPNCGTPSTLEPLNVVYFDHSIRYQGEIQGPQAFLTREEHTPSTKLKLLNVELPLHWNTWNSLYSGTPNVEHSLHWNP